MSFLLQLDGKWNRREGLGYSLYVIPSLLLLPSVPSCSWRLADVRRTNPTGHLSPPPRSIWILGKTPRAKHYLPPYCQILPIHSTQLQSNNHYHFDILHYNVGLWIRLLGYYLVSDTYGYDGFAECY